MNKPTSQEESKNTTVVYSFFRLREHVLACVIFTMCLLVMHILYLIEGTELSIGLRLFGSGSDFENLSGFNRTGRRSKLEIFGE